MKLRNKKTGGLANCEPIEVRTDAGFHDYYEPKEPLIKDEKVRKAVRAWAAANDYKKCYVRVCDYDIGGICSKDGTTTFVSCETSLVITFFGVDLGIKTEIPYTIAELCGEEEE